MEQQEAPVLPLLMEFAQEVPTVGDRQPGRETDTLYNQQHSDTD